MPCFGAMGPMGGPTHPGRRWAGPCHQWGWRFHTQGRKEWQEHLERYAEMLREELAAVEAEIRGLAPEKKGP